MTARRAYQLCEAAEVVKKLENVKHVSQIQNARQAEALAKAPTDRREEVLEKAIKTAPNGKVTAKHIEKTVAGMTSAPETANEETNENGLKSSPLQAAIKRLNKVIDQALATLKTSDELAVLRAEMEALSRKLQHPVVDV